MTVGATTESLRWELERPEDAARWWVRDNLYTLEPRTPLSDSVFTAVWDEAALCISEMMSVPDARGFNARTVNGYTYLSPIPITDGALIEKRLAAFLERIHNAADNLERDLERTAREQKEEHEYWDSADLGTGNLLILLELWRRALLTLDHFWKLHFRIVFPRHAMAGTFEETAREVAGIESSAEYGKLVQAMGMTRQLSFDAALWNLAARAIELGLSETFIGTLETELRDQLEDSDAGRTWLGELDELLAVNGRRQTLPMELNDPTWAEDPRPVLGTIRTYVAEGGEYDFEALMAEMAEEQRKLEEAALARISGDEDRARFEGMLGPVRGLQAAMEDDNFELSWSHAQVRAVALEIGDRLAAAGVLDSQDDVFFLRKDEVERALVDLATGFYDMSGLGRAVSERRDAWEAARVAQAPPYIGELPDEIEDFLLNQFWGIRGRKQLDATDGELTGTGASGGVVEGVARRVLTPEQFGQVQPGEVLVCRSTNPAWTPLFSKVCAVVADQGGTLAHAAIVAREYGIPAVLGTMHGTARIPDGARVRVDGDSGTVTIL
jgi:phosphohistidine swiveling domain-containing protein